MSIIAFLAIGWWLYQLDLVSAEVRRERARGKRQFPAAPIADRQRRRSGGDLPLMAVLDRWEGPAHRTATTKGSGL